MVAGTQTNASVNKISMSQSVHNQNDSGVGPEVSVVTVPSPAPSPLHPLTPPTPTSSSPAPEVKGQNFNFRHPAFGLAQLACLMSYHLSVFQKETLRGILESPLEQPSHLVL